MLVVHISPELTSFVRKDIEILARAFNVEHFFYSGRADIPRLATSILSYDLTYSWFAWDNAAWAVRLSRLTGKKSVVVVGGFDVTMVPEINYGNLINPSSARRTLYALTNADAVIAVSNFTMKEAIDFSGRNDIEVVYHGFDREEFYPEGEKERIVLSVGDVGTSNMRRKGMQTFFEVAKILHDVPFILVGRVHRDIRGILERKKPDNLRMAGAVSDPELLNYMQRAKVYVQVSAHEGFGCSLAEAMLCECVPVVTRRAAIPEVVGNCGYYVPYRNPVATAQAIREALGDEEMGRRCRERVAEKFPLENRERRIVELVDGLLS
ncbi:MAG: glycosyltransferase family 4 protein [Thermoplasmata archaeon]